MVCGSYSGREGTDVAANRRVRVGSLHKGDRVKLQGDYSEAGWCRVERLSRPSRGEYGYNADEHTYLLLELTTETGQQVAWYYLPDSLLLRGDGDGRRGVGRGT
jgi:hypothetical protein